MSFVSRLVWSAIVISSSRRRSRLFHVSSRSVMWESWNLLHAVLKSERDSSHAEISFNTQSFTQELRFTTTKDQEMIITTTTTTSLAIIECQQDVILSRTAEETRNSRFNKERFLLFWFDRSFSKNSQVQTYQKDAFWFWWIQNSFYRTLIKLCMNSISENHIRIICALLQRWICVFFRLNFLQVRLSRMWYSSFKSHNRSRSWSARWSLEIRARNFETQDTACFLKSWNFSRLFFFSTFR